MKKIKEFYKMEGIGNDYIYLDLTEQEISKDELDVDNIKKICDRRFGVGGDGLVIITKSKNADVKMLMWNNDGSYSKICGNALRCVAYYWYKKTDLKKFYIESGVEIHLAEILKEEYPTAYVKINMGRPIFDKTQIPYLGDSKKENVYIFYDSSILPYEGIVLSMGNPHCIFFVDQIENISVERYGSLIENHKLFPDKTNVEFVVINSDHTLTQLTWERGSGETLACGSGACAVLVASVLTKNLPKKNIVHLKGGDLEIEWNQSDDQIYMSGNATFVFEGQLLQNFSLFKNH